MAAAVPPASAAEIWVDNPNFGNLNPGTKEGQTIFENKTKTPKDKNRPTATKKYDQAIRRFLENKAPDLGKFVTRIPIKCDARGAPTVWGNLLCECSSISMKLLQRKAHKRLRDTVATDDTLPAVLFTVTTLDPVNDNDDKKLYYYRVDSQVVAELIKNILTNAEYSKLMLKKNMFTFQDDSIGNEIIDGPFLIKVLFDCIDPNVAIGVKVLRQKLKATKLHPYQNNVDAMLMDMGESY